MKSDVDLKIDVSNSLQWEPQLHHTEIKVVATEGVVSLAGVVDSYAKKKLAETTAKGVSGVRALLDNIEVRFPSPWSKTDIEVSNDVMQALKVNWPILQDMIQVKVDDGMVTLIGEVPWFYQREGAQNSIQYLQGVKGVVNAIEIKSESDDVIEQKEIEAALGRSWATNDNDIHVTVLGATATLTGTVKAWFQKEEAGRIAWNTRGISHVNNDLIVDYYYALVY